MYLKHFFVTLNFLQYGLVLLEEKEQLEIRCEELETLYETTKNDLEITQSALEKFQSSQQVKIRLKKPPLKIS